MLEATGIDKLGAAIQEALETTDVGDVLSLITGVFVSLTVELVRREGHDINKSIRVDGGENRDITIHEPK